MFCWAIVLCFLAAKFRYKLHSLGSFAMPIPLLMLGFIMMRMDTADRVASAIQPALKSNWLTIHVSTAILAYAGFAISFGLGIMYLIRLRTEQEGAKPSRLAAHLPASEQLDNASYKMIGFAFPMLSLCIITGAIWANYAWGAYWSWDPKETWSLITWIIYAVYLHMRLLRGWKGKRAAWMCVLGFAAVLFTFFGVNYLLPGLHSYM